MLRVCFFSGCMTNGGGTEHMTQLVANNLVADENYQVYVLSKSSKGKKTFYQLDEKINYDVLDDAAYHGVRTVFKDILLLRKYILKNHIDILVNVDVSLGVFSMPLKIFCPQLKQVYWEHFSVHYDVGNKRMQMLRNMALKCGNAYVTLTKEDAEVLNRQKKKHCKIVPLPNICGYSVSESLYDVTSHRILTVGNMLHVKGFDLALQVACIVLKKHRDWMWEFYGDGVEKDNLINLAENLEIADNICFKGRVEDLKEAYSRASLYVMTSRSEGFGLVLAEAKAHHLPTIAFDVPYGPRNLIEDSINGYLIEPYDIEEMARKICILMEDESKRKEFSAAALNGLERYSETVVMKEWKKLLGGL